MTRPRRGRPQQHHRPQHRNDDPQLPREVVEKFGDVWTRLAWHATVWTQLLVEIPTQLHDFERTSRAPLEARVREIRRYWRDSEYADDISRILTAWHRPQAQIGADGRIVTISHETGIWPNVKLVAVEFMITGGEIAIQCRNTPDDRPKLPPFLRGPYRDRTAKQEASNLVGAAITLVAEPMPAIPPPPPSAA